MSLKISHPMKAVVITPQTNTGMRFKTRPHTLNSVSEKHRTREETFIANCPNCNNELELGEVEPVLCPFCGFDLEEYEDMVFGCMMEEAMKEPDNLELVDESVIMDFLRNR